MRYYDPENNALSALFIRLTYAADGFPEKAWQDYSKKQQRAILDTVKAHLEENGSLLSEEVRALMRSDPAESFGRFCQALRSAHQRAEAAEAARREEWLAFAKRFDPLTEQALVRLLDGPLLSFLLLQVEGDGQVALWTDAQPAFRQTVYLENPVLGGEFDPDSVQTDAEIICLEGGYRLSFVQYHQIYTVDFTGVRVVTIPLDYTAQLIWDDSPWHRVSSALQALRQKEEIFGTALLNEQEQKLRPLADFAPIHDIPMPKIPAHGGEDVAALFCALAERAGARRAAMLARQYAAAKPEAQEKIRRALVTAMKTPESEALARLIMSKLRAAAAEYPTEVALTVSSDTLAAARQAVTAIMRQHGYEGEYPNFCRMAAIGGVRILEMNRQPSWVCNEKNVACLVDCWEYCSGKGKLRIKFTASTVFLKEKELPLYDTLDGYSGFFPHKERRRGRNIAQFPFFETDEVAYDLKTVAVAAAKVAACEKLSLEERKAISFVPSGLYGCLFYGIGVLFAGGTFGLLFCPAMFLLCLLIGLPFTLLAPEAPSFWEYFRFLLTDLPWLWLFLFCVAGFGLPMMVLSVLAKKRG